jgi:metal-dependent HD superfamily phosphatase/phosphodiesterase
MKTLVINFCAAENLLSGRGPLRMFQYIREIKSVSKMAVKRVIVFCNGVHVSVHRTAKPAYCVVLRLVGHLTDIKYAM